MGERAKPGSALEGSQEAGTGAMTADIRTAAEPYTPTTDEVREAIAEWSWSRRMFRDELAQSDGSEFDRWHAKHTPTREQVERALIGRDFIAGADAILALLAGLAEGETGERSHP